MKKVILSILTSAGCIMAANADAPLWLRDVAISPDGNTVAFTYKGDIFTISPNGGRASQLTSNPRYDSRPLWSPDGRHIAFASNREGSDDIYIIPATGGTARRLTTHSGTETPLAFLNDSTLIFSSAARPGSAKSVAPSMPQTYTINVNLPAPRPVLFQPIPMMAASVRSDGKLLYQDKKGFENRFRKHERSAGTSDIWLLEPASREFTKLTSFDGHDLNPVWNGTDRFYYVSEKDGTLNVYSRSTDGTAETQITHFTKHPVRSLSAAADGTIAYSWDGELYLQRPGGQPFRPEIEIITDDYNSDKVKNIRSSGAETMAVSPEGDEVAFTLRGDVYVTSTKYKTTKRVTNTSGQERNLSFGSDGRSLVYDSDRDGSWRIYRSKITNPDEKEFAYATALEEELLYSSDHSAQQPLVSPDGRYVAFLEDKCEIRVLDLDTKQTLTVLPAEFNYSYVDGDISFEWSPDSKWLLTSYMDKGGWNNMDIALVSRDGKTIINLTESGHSDSNPHWALNGRAVVYDTAKYGMKSQGSWGNQSDAVVMVLDPEAWDEFNLTKEEADLKEKAEKEKDDKDKADSSSDNKKVKKDKKAKKSKSGKNEKAAPEPINPDQFDIASRRYRTSRLTDRSSAMGDYFLSPKGDKFYYISSATEGGRALYARDLRQGDTKVLAKGVSGSLIPDKKGENLFVQSYNGMSKISLADGEEKSIDFEAFYDRKPSAEREYIYDHMLTQVREKFYDEKLHGVDWKGYGDHYRRFLPHINNNRDFADLMSEILGELNASHTGSGTSTGSAPLSTAELGIVTDDNFRDPGIRIAEILPQSPLATKKAGVKAGDIITAIDGTTILPNADYYPLLEGKAGKKVNLTVVTSGADPRNVTVKAISGGSQSGMLYRRWVEHNEHVVDSISGGRIGYVHVRGMDTESFQNVYDRLLGHYRNADAVIVDTRYNGGGWLHNDLALLLSGKEYVRYAPRGRYIGSDPFSQWTKPSVMLVNESNYSDAHGSPYVYQTLGLGDIVGAPVPGTMTAVWWEAQIDPSIYFGIPQVTSLDRSGQPLENKQLTPDLLIYNTPGALIGGHDEQLEGATRHLMQKLAK